MDTRRKLKAKRKLACSARSGRVEERFKFLVEQGNYYEAHQTMRALYQRFLVQGRNEKALKLLRQCGLLLLEKCQWEGGTEVSITFVRLLREQEQMVTDEILYQIEQLFNCYKFFEETEYVPHPHVPGMRTVPRLNNLTKEEISKLTVMQHNREMFMKAALKWSSIDERYKRGHSRLHNILAKAYFEEGELSKSRYHLMYTNTPETLGGVLVELATVRGNPSEADLFITQAVLQLLVLENKGAAFDVFRKYLRTHTLFSSMMPLPFKKRPLVNFTWFMMLSFDIGDVVLFDFLVKCYTPVINRDTSYFKYLDRIRSTYFNTTNHPPPARSTSSGLFDLLMGGIGDLGGGASGGDSMGDLFSSLTNMLPGNLFGGGAMTPPTNSRANRLPPSAGTDELD